MRITRASAKQTDAPADESSEQSNGEKRAVQARGKSDETSEPSHADNQLTSEDADVERNEAEEKGGEHAASKKRKSEGDDAEKEGKKRTRAGPEDDDDNSEADQRENASENPDPVDEYTLKREAAIAQLLAEEEKESEDVDPDAKDAGVVVARNGNRKGAPATIDGRSRDMFLDTVNRHMLDFDFEKLCSVSLSDLNVYGCLVCGKYFQGRGKSSHAYFHSIHEAHHVYINLHNLKIYVLPDMYEVEDSSLNDIKYVLKPTFTPEQVKGLDTNNSIAYDLNNKKYIPGFIGLNNIKANDYVNVILQGLAHLTELRDYFILADLKDKSQLTQRFGNLLRKMWSPRGFKGQVSPHEVLQAISTASHKRFRSTEQADTVDFLSWFLNALHKDLGGTKKADSSIIYKCFQGEVRVETQTIGAPKEDDASGEKPRAKEFDSEREFTSVKSPFLYLTLDLPPAPLFQDELEKNIIPQVPLVTLLEKFDGRTAQENQGVLRRYRITKLPNYLIFHIRRFTKNNWAAEKNPTIVNFPLQNIDMSEYVDAPPPGISTHYDLIANIVHEGGVADKNKFIKKKGALKIGGTAEGQGVYKVHVQQKAHDQWYQIQDLFVEEVMPQLIFLSESYLQIWARNKVTVR